MAKNLTLMLERLLGHTPWAPTMSVRQAKDAYADHRASRGLPRRYAPLLTAPDANPKLDKSIIPTYGLSLAPANLSGYNVCPWSTPMCRSGCLNTAGRGDMEPVQDGRIVKTQFFAENPIAFLVLTEHEIRLAVKRHGRILMRLNVYSDLRWERFAPWLFDIDGVDWYDYTKSYARAFESADWQPNYVLTASAHERTTPIQIMALRAAGVSVAKVFTRIPSQGVVNGDLTDDRYHEPKGVLVALKAKGKMRKNPAAYAGFVTING